MKMTGRQMTEYMRQFPQSERTGQASYMPKDLHITHVFFYPVPGRFVHRHCLTEQRHQALKFADYEAITVGKFYEDMEQSRSEFPESLLER